MPLFPGVEPFPTHHCITGSLRRSYEAAGIPITEELLLGLGAGVGFAYWHFTGTDPFLGGRANVERKGVEGLEKTVCRRTSVGVSVRTTSSLRTARTSLERLVDAQTPTMLYVDMGMLDYLGLPDGYHFGAHTIVVVGSDGADGGLFVGDRDPEFHPIGWDELEQARSSTFKPFPPKNKWFEFDFSSYSPATPEDIRTAILECCDGMLSPPIANLGVRGIRTAATKAAKWPTIMDEESLRRTCVNAAIFIEPTGGTGGGIFRYLYARFLREVSPALADPALLPIADSFEAIGDRWEAAAAGLHTAAEAEAPEAALEPVVESLSEVAEAEERAWSDLEAAIN